MLDAVENVLAMVLVRQIISLEQGGAQVIPIGTCSLKTREERWLKRIENLGLCFSSLVLRLALRVFENVTFEEGIVGISSFVEEARSLSVEL